MTEISIRDLNRDVARIIIGKIEENAFEKFVDNSVIYHLHDNYRPKPTSDPYLINMTLPPTYSYYFTKSKEKMINILKTINDIQTRRNLPSCLIRYFSYDIIRINPKIDVGGVYVFCKGGNPINITNDIEEAKDFYERNKEFVNSIDINKKSTIIEEYFIKFEDESKIESLMTSE